MSDRVEDKGRDENNKVLVFSTFRHTIATYRSALAPWKVRVGVMHGGIPDDMRLDVRRRFKLDDPTRPPTTSCCAPRSAPKDSTTSFATRW